VYPAAHVSATSVTFGAGSGELLGKNGTALALNATNDAATIAQTREK